MENGTSGSDARAPGTRALCSRLDMLARIARRNLDLKIWFAEITGRRWSYLAGVRKGTPSNGTGARIPLVGGIGMVIDDWSRLDEEQRQEMVVFMRALVAELTGAPAKEAGHGP